MMTRTIAAIGLLSTAACATTDPGTGARIAYHLPRTDAAVAMDLVLTSCTGDIAVDAEMKVLPVAGAQDQSFEIHGSDLASARIKRELAISVDENGVIKSINSGNEDQTAQIIGNVIKTAATVLPLFGLAGNVQSGTATPRCKPEVAAAVERRAWIVAAIAGLRRQLAAAGAERPELVRQIARLAREQGTIEQTILHSVSFSKAVTLEPGQAAGEVEFDYSDAAKWFVTDDTRPDVTAQQLAQLFSAEWTAVPAEAAVAEQERRSADSSKRCDLSVAVPAVREVAVTVTGTGTALPEKLAATAKLPAGQYATPGRLCLGAGFGESRSVKLQFDKFGRTTEFGWNSSARAAAITGAVAGYAGDLGSIYGTLEGPEKTAKQKTEIDRLTTQQRLNELRRCQAIIEAGGFDCDAASEAEH